MMEDFQQKIKKIRIAEIGQQQVNHGQAHNLSQSFTDSTNNSNDSEEEESDELEEGETIDDEPIFTKDQSVISKTRVCSLCRRKIDGREAFKLHLKKHHSDIFAGPETRFSGTGQPAVSKVKKRDYYIDDSAAAKLRALNKKVEDFDEDQLYFLQDYLGIKPILNSNDDFLKLTRYGDVRKKRKIDHELNSIRLQAEKWDCFHCRKIFDSQETLIGHIESHHNDEIKSVDGNQSSSSSVSEQTYFQRDGFRFGLDLNQMPEEGGFDDLDSYSCKS